MNGLEHRQQVNPEKKDPKLRRAVIGTLVIAATLLINQTSGPSVFPKAEREMPEVRHQYCYSAITTANDSVQFQPSDLETIAQLDWEYGEQARSEHPDWAPSAQKFLTVKNILAANFLTLEQLSYVDILLIPPANDNCLTPPENNVVVVDARDIRKAIPDSRIKVWQALTVDHDLDSLARKNSVVLRVDMDGETGKTKRTRMARLMAVHWFGYDHTTFPIMEVADDYDLGTTYGTPDFYFVPIRSKIIPTGMPNGGSN